MDKTVMLTVGLPYSGKSTWAREYAKTHNTPVVNIDSIRMATYGRKFESLAEGLVWSIAKIMVRSLFFAGHDYVIVDSHNMTGRSRVTWTTEPTWNVMFKVFETSPDICKQRARENELDTSKMVSFIDNMVKNFDVLTENDSFLDDE